MEDVGGLVVGVETDEVGAVTKSLAAWLGAPWPNRSSGTQLATFGSTRPPGGGVVTLGLGPVDSAQPKVRRHFKNRRPNRPELEHKFD